MVAQNAIKYILFFFVRILLVCYGFGNLLGLLWFSNTINIWSFFSGLTAGFTGLIAGFTNFKAKSFHQNVLAYIIVSSLGCIVTLYQGIQYVLPKDSSLKTGLPHFIIVFCYLVAIFVAAKKSRPIETPPGKEE